MTVQLGTVEFETESGGVTLSAALGSKKPLVTEGYGGWEQLSVRKGHPITQWTGSPGVAVAFSVVLMVDDTLTYSCEDDCRTLERLASPSAGAFADEPPILTFDSAGIVPWDGTHWPNVRWVMSELSWTEDLLEFNVHGHRVRASADVTMMRYYTDNAIETTQRPPAKPKYRHYTWRKGDSIRKVAHHYLGNRNRYREILKLNGLRDARSLKPGMRLKIPPR